MNLTEWITKEDLSIKEFAEEFVNVVKENFGKHNYKCVTDIVNKHLANDVETSHDKALHKHFVSNHVKNACTNCKFCELYENENWKPSNIYHCLLTDEKISDIDENYCDAFDAE